MKGKAGPVVFYQQNGQQVVRSSPSTIKQTEGMKRSSAHLAKASRLSSNFRQLLAPAIQGTESKLKTHQLLCGIFNKWLHARDKNPEDASLTPQLASCNFNRETRFSERFRCDVRFHPDNNTRLRLRIPPFMPAARIGAPINTRFVLLHIRIVSCRLSDAEVIAHAGFSLEIALNTDNHPGVNKIFDIPLGPGLISIAAGALVYYLADGSVEQRKEFMPSSVIYAG